jgi:hypothetical protein
VSTTTEPDLSKTRAGKRVMCEKGNVVHEFVASMMNLSPTKALPLIADVTRQCGFFYIDFRKLYSLRLKNIL